MQVLSIGNSFSQDATRYLHQIARSDGVSLQTVNLYVGGCSLSRHYRNMLSLADAYELETNGSPTGFYVNLKSALLNRDWDFITLQQVSHLSINYDTYQPYLSALADFIREQAPGAKILLHETWAYEQGSARLCGELGYSDHREMSRDILEASRRAARDIDACGIIPSGELFERMLERGVGRIHRDTFHATLGLGRFALGLLWYRCLTGKSVLNIPFADLDEPANPDELKIAKQAAEEVGTEKIK